jgi:hypothetical protein
MRFATLLAITLVTSAACSDSKGSHPIAISAPSIAISAPTEGQQITGSSTVAVTGSVTGEGIQSVTVSVNGGTAVTATVANGAFSASVTLESGSNTLVATALAAGGSASATVHVSYSPAPVAPAPVAPAPAAVIAITAPFEGQRVAGPGSRVMVVTGTVAGQSIQAVTVSVNGGAGVPATVSNGTFSATVTLAGGANTLVATVTSAAEPASATVHLSYPYVALTTFKPASVVIGQAGFTSRDAARTPAANTLRRVYGNPGFDGTRLFVPDYEDNRVLTFDTVPTASNASATYALGQASGSANLTSTTEGASATVWNGPQTVQAVGTQLFVVDHDNSRVLIVSPAAGATATVAVRATTTAGTTCEAAGLDLPQSLFVTGTRLIVADSGNNRVLIWNSIPAQGTAPSVVLGQASFTSCNPNRSTAVGAAPGQNTLSYPSDVWSDGTRLYVADTGNNRILVWNDVATLTNGKAADVVLGQAGSFTSATAGTGAGAFRHPSFVGSNGNQLFVADSENNRVLVWNTLPVTNVAADLVLGQNDFTHGAANDDDQNGFEDTVPSARTLAEPSGVTVLDNALIVGDHANRRYLIFR